MIRKPQQKSWTVVQLLQTEVTTLSRALGLVQALDPVEALAQARKRWPLLPRASLAIDHGKGETK